MSALRTPHRIPIEGLIRRLGRGAERVRHNRAMAWSNIYLQIIINFNGFPTEKQGRRPWVAEHTAKGPSDTQGFVPFAQITPIPVKVSKSDPLI